MYVMRIRSTFCSVVGWIPLGKSCFTMDEILKPAVKRKKKKVSSSFSNSNFDEQRKGII